MIYEAIDVKLQIRVSGCWFYIPIAFSDGKILSSPDIRNAVIIRISWLFFAAI